MSDSLPLPVITSYSIHYTKLYDYLPTTADGTIKVRDMFSLYKYENFLYTMDLTGEQIRKFMEFSYGGWFNTMKGPDDDLIAFAKDKDRNNFV